MTKRTVVLKQLPTLWLYRVASQAIGLHVDDREVWGGWENGMVVAVDHAGKLQRKWRLRSGVDALIADERSDVRPTDRASVRLSSTPVRRNPATPVRNPSVRNLHNPGLESPPVNDQRRAVPAIA